MTNRELDRWIAENVMGFPVENGIVLHGCGWQPTESILEAFQVVEKIREKGFEFSLRSDELRIWIACFHRQPANQYAEINCMHGDTAPLAICLAAKKAVEMEGR